MRVYNCLVNVGQAHVTTIAKSDVTAAEILVLRAIHGDDAVTEIKRGRMDKRAHREEYDRLTNIYGATAIKLGGDENAPSIPVLNAIFGPAGAARLPVELNDDGDFPFVDAKIEKAETKAGVMTNGGSPGVEAAA